METTITPNFQIQFDPAEFTPSGELAAIRQKVQVIATVCESDMSTLAVWFGIVVSDKFGSSNRVIVTLTKNVTGGENTGFSSHNSQMRVNPKFGAPDDILLGNFAAELSEIFMDLEPVSKGYCTRDGCMIHGIICNWCGDSRCGRKSSERSIGVTRIAIRAI